MKVTEQVHQIRIDFQVTEQVQRYVYIYMITGRDCYLIDTGVAGSEKIIAEYMRDIGRSINEVKAIFLTHAHPDHIGSAAAIRQQTECKIYCSAEERPWIADVDLQFRERPVPNFYGLAGRSVPIDEVVRNGDCIKLEDDIELEVIGTAGHSKGDVSYFMNGRVFFSGDAVPAAGDVPIFDNFEKSIQSLDKISVCTFAKCCPAWDRVYEKGEREALLRERKELLYNLKETVRMVDRQYAGLSEHEKISMIAAHMGLSGAIGNPLFAASVEACRN